MWTRRLVPFAAALLVTVFGLCATALVAQAPSGTKSFDPTAIDTDAAIRAAGARGDDVLSRGLYERCAWSVEVPWPKIEPPLYEFACHEQNYGLMNVGTGAQIRARENAARPARETPERDR